MLTKAVWWILSSIFCHSCLSIMCWKSLNKKRWSLKCFLLGVLFGVDKHGTDFEEFSQTHRKTVKPKAATKHWGFSYFAYFSFKFWFSIRRGLKISWIRKSFSFSCSSCREYMKIHAWINTSNFRPIKLKELDIRMWSRKTIKAWPKLLYVYYLGTDH